MEDQEQTQEQTTETESTTDAAQNTGDQTGTAATESKEEFNAETATDTPKAPESPDEYKVELDGFDFEAFKADEFNAQFLQEAHQAGFTNEQLSVALKAHEQYTAVAVDALKEEWGGDFEKNINLAKQAFAAAGMETNQIDSPTAALRLAAFVGSKLGEDMPPLNVHQNGTESVAELMASEAYMNERHPDHKRVYAQVQNFYSETYR